MRKRNHIFRGWKVFAFIAFLAIPLLGWTAFPLHADHGTAGDRHMSVTAARESASTQISAPGNVQRGQDLFMGYVHFQNDGPPCMGCHNVGDNGILGGGVMGPDLTNVSTKRSADQIAAILSNRGTTISPVMQPIFAEHPLTASEQADLIAFLNASVGQPESNREILVIGISLAGFVAAVLLLGFVYRGRLRGVRRPLIKKVQAENQ